MLVDLLGARGIIDMGVNRGATVEEAVLYSRRRRRHRMGLLNDIEAELNIIAEKLRPEKKDVSLWRGRCRSFLHLRHGGCCVMPKVPAVGPEVFGLLKRRRSSLS